MEKIKYVKYAKTNTWHRLDYKGEINMGANCNGRWKSYHYNDTATNINEIKKGSKLCRKCFNETIINNDGANIKDYQLI